MENKEENKKEEKITTKVTDEVKTNEKTSKDVLKKTEETVLEKPEEKQKKEEKSREEKKEISKPLKEKEKKTEAVINVEDLPISTKYSAAICKFIKNKKIGDAISDLEQVLKHKKSVPMKGEIAHRKGKGMMSGKFPERSTLRFIILLKSLAANSNHNGLENPIITEAIANIGSRPYGRFGSVRKKRTHVRITAKERKTKDKLKEVKK